MKPEVLTELFSAEVLDDDKAEFVEKQAQLCLDFAIESRSLLNKEAHTTLNWLISVIVGSGAFLTSQLDAEVIKWWLIWPIAGVLVLATSGAISLFVRALRTSNVLGPGNEPQNLLKPSFLASELKWLKVSEAFTIQERIEKANLHNERVGDAINFARWILVLLPAIGLVVALISYWTLSD